MWNVRVVETEILKNCASALRLEIGIIAMPIVTSHMTCQDDGTQSFISRPNTSFDASLGKIIIESNPPYSDDDTVQ